MQMWPRCLQIVELFLAVTPDVARRRHRRAGELDAERALAGGPVVTLERIARHVERPRAVDVAGQHGEVADLGALDHVEDAAPRASLAVPGIRIARDRAGWRLRREHHLLSEYGPRRLVAHRRHELFRKPTLLLGAKQVAVWIFD